MRERAGDLDGAVANQRALVEQPLYHLLDEERVTLGALDHHAFEWFEFDAVTQQRREHLPRAFPPQGIQPQLRVVGLVGPLVAILRTIVHQHQHARIGDAVREQIEQRLRLAVDPMQVLEDDNRRLIQAFAQDDALDCVEGAPALDLRVHLGVRVRALM